MLNQIHWRYKQVGLTASTLSSECYVISTTLSHLQILLSERPEFLDPLTAEQRTISACFETIILGTASSLSVLDAKVEQARDSKFRRLKQSFGVKYKFVWDESLLKELSQQIESERSSISFLIDFVKT